MMRIIKNKKINEWYEKYDHYITPVALLAGFVLDNFTLRRIDLWAENIAIILYLFIAGVSILFINAHEVGYFKSRIFDKYAKIVPIILQFTFGGLFSVFIVFYSRSASIIVSWPFILFLAGLFIGNEMFKKRYLRLTFQISIFFIALFSYLIFAVPIIVGRIGPEVFIVGGLLSLVLIFFGVSVIHRFMPTKLRHSRNLLIYSIGGIYLIFNILYFTNIIPPIPLSLKEGGIYHNIIRDEAGQYVASFEPAPWYRFGDFNDTFHWKPGTAVYNYSSVFSPAKFATDIAHRWSYFDDEQSKWIMTDKIGFTVFGGRGSGYRGYTFKKNIIPGKWKVEVITDRGQVLGRTVFNVIEVKEAPELYEEIL